MVAPSRGRDITDAAGRETAPMPRPRRPAPLGIAVATMALALLGSACNGAAPTSSGSSSDPTPIDAQADPPSADGLPTTDPVAVDDPEILRPATGPTGVASGGTTVSLPSARPSSGPLQVRDIDFAGFTFPSSACAGVIAKPPVDGYALVDGTVRSGAPTDEGSYGVRLATSRSFGDVNGDQVEDVTLILECDRGNRPIPVGWVYTVADGAPRALARISLDPDTLPLRWVLDAELDSLRIEGATVVSTWDVYLDGDAICCPTSSATVTWNWGPDSLMADAPVLKAAAATG